MPDSTTELLRETLTSERRRVTALALIFGAGAIGLPWLALIGRGDWLAAEVTFGALALGCGYQLYLRSALARLAKAGRAAPDVARYFNAVAETASASALVFAMAHAFGAQSAIAARMGLVYFVFIILAALRLSASLCLCTGLSAALQAFGLRLLLSGGSALGPAALEGLLLAGGGMLTAVVTVEIRRRVEASFALVQERNHVLSIFGQHVSPAVADHLVALGTELGGELRFVCVMFLDIRNFTAFSEKRPPEQVVGYLNALFEPMVETVNRHQGIINKFLGDGFMAVFGAPIADARECDHAVAAALQILAEVAAQVQAGAIPATRVGIGIHAGQALTGTVGSASRKEYTVIGDVVNLASRIEALNKEHDTQLLVSAPVAARSGRKGMTPLGAMGVRGRTEPVDIFKVA